MAVPTSVESQLLAEPIGRLDLSEYCLVTADTSVRDTVKRMRAMKKGCAFVIGKGTQLMGIFTDRDVLRKVVTAPEIWDQAIETVMTLRPDTLTPEATTGEALRLMQEKGYRNVPVVGEDGVIQGNVTSFAILRFLSDHFPAEVYNLPPKAEDWAEKRAGG